MILLGALKFGEFVDDSVLELMISQYSINPEEKTLQEMVMIYHDQQIWLFLTIGGVPVHDQ